ncbi:MAG TPA: hypothetical protein PLV85_26445, partial [Polyangiaceae bacterium]|nr:hypothetical protein [Polyangiaceae bacterium]
TEQIAFQAALLLASISREAKRRHASNGKMCRTYHQHGCCYGAFSRVTHEPELPKRKPVATAVVMALSSRAPFMVATLSHPIP